MREGACHAFESFALADRWTALGAVATHDLALCLLSGELTDRLKLVHFRENVVNDAMTFDYLLRPGPVTAGNALRLMRSLGLDVPVEGE
jgi:DNA mismatch repair ATPase MutS